MKNKIRGVTFVDFLILLSIVGILVAVVGSFILQTKDTEIKQQLNVGSDPYVQIITVPSSNPNYPKTLECHLVAIFNSRCIVCAGYKESTTQCWFPKEGPSIQHEIPTR